MRFQPWAIPAVLVTMTSLILSVLLLFAGHKPGFMDDYSVLTLNTSRIGENIVQDIDNDIMALNITKILDVKDERSLNADLMPTITTAPDEPITMITIVPRAIGSLINSLASEATDKASSAGSAITNKATEVVSGASSIQTAAATEITSAFNTIQAEIVKNINEKYTDIILSLGIREFYTVHLMAICEGHYVYPNGTNMTTEVTPALPPRSTVRHVDLCSRRLALHPLRIVRNLYIIGIFFTVLAMFSAVCGALYFSRKSALLNILALIPAVFFVGLASAELDGLAVGATQLINFLAHDAGVDSDVGERASALTWVATTLLSVNVLIWGGLVLFEEETWSFPSLERRG